MDNNNKNNSNGDLLPIDNLFNRFFNLGGLRKGGSLFDMDNLLRDFDEMHKEMNRMFNQFSDIQSNPPKELVREYQTSEGEKVREFGPIVYGYSMTIGPDGKPHIREFGNVKSPLSSLSGNTNSREGGGIKSH